MLSRTSVPQEKSGEPRVESIYKTLDKRLFATLTLGHKQIVGDEKPCFIIAEVGQNHMGDLNIAEKLIDVAAEGGANCVKFQKSDLESRFNKEALLQPYESKHSFGRTYGEHRSVLEFTEEEFVHLQAYAHSRKIEFTASGMDKKSVDFLAHIGVPFFKVGSADCANYPLLTHIAGYRKPMVISTGMHDLSTISDMYEYLRTLNTHIALLQCTSSYPTPPREVNLNVIETYKSKFPYAVVGYSGHEIGIGISIAAVALGARILERHITLDHDLKGTDHICSLDSFEFKHMVSEIRRVEQALGSFEKKIHESEAICMEKLSKTVVASMDLPAGTILDEDMIELKVAIPKGWEAWNANEILGRTLLRDVQADCSICESDVE